MIWMILNGGWMAFECRLQKLELENRALHHYLDAGDECYFIGEYTSGQGFGYSEFNQLIYNLKKDPSRRHSNPQEYRYKERAIITVADCLARTIKPEFLESKITLVPIPPSKTKAHPSYDDRILRICNGIVASIETPDVCELIQCGKDIDATHSDDHKPKPGELKKTYNLICPQGYKPRDIVFLLDDVLTTGTHFRACKEMILEAFPSVVVVGIFVARRIFPPKPGMA